MSRLTPEERCSENVRGEGQWGWMHPHQCSRRGVITEEGNLWCKQHAPSAVKARRGTIAARWSEESAARDIAFTRRAAED